MRTARFIGSWFTALLAVTAAAGLFVQWLQFVLGQAGTGAPTILFLWIAFGVNLAVWMIIGVFRAVEDSARALVRRGGERGAHRRGHAPAHRRRVSSSPREPALAGSSAALAGAHSAAVTSTVPMRLNVLDTGELPLGNGSTGDSGSRPAEASLAVIIPAHNEEPVISAAITSALRLFNRWDIYVVSDSSRDSTADLAAETGVNVLELLTNRGKAGAIEAVIAEFDLIGNYDGVVILDADTELDENYVRGVRRQLQDPTVGAVAGFVVAEWKPAERTLVGRLISAYRDRLYFMLQYLMRFGQTWRFTNTAFIVPGFASAYRTSALREIDINPKGLVIEDYNMTFELHHKRLGRISMNPDTKAYCQDPFTLRDYVSQVRRWTLGFWQTVRRHGLWPSLFCFALFFYILEVLLVTVLLLATVALGVFTLLPPLTDGAVLGAEWYASAYATVVSVLPLSVIAMGLFVPDYMLTCVMAAIRRRPSYLVLGLFFLPLRLVDAYITLRTLPQAWTVQSDGRWRSPGRAAGRL